MLRPLSLSLLLAFSSLNAIAALPTSAITEVETLIRAQSLDEAKISIQKYIKKDPANAPLHYYLAQVYAAQGQWDEAAAMLKKAKYFDWRLKFASSKDKVAKLEELIAHNKRKETQENVSRQDVRTDAKVPVLTEKIVPRPAPNTTPTSGTNQKDIAQEKPKEEKIELDEEIHSALEPVITEPVERAARASYDHNATLWAFATGAGAIGLAIGASTLLRQQKKEEIAAQEQALKEERLRVTQSLDRVLSDIVFIAPFKQQFSLQAQAQELQAEVQGWKKEQFLNIDNLQIENALLRMREYRAALYN